MGKHKNMGTPWHLETLRMSDGDSRRDKRLCTYFSDGICKCSDNYNLYMGRCMGSAHCDYYTDRQPTYDIGKLSTSAAATDDVSIYIRKIRNRELLEVNDYNRKEIRDAVYYAMRNYRKMFNWFGMPKYCYVCGNDIGADGKCSKCLAVYIAKDTKTKRKSNPCFIV